MSTLHVVLLTFDDDPPVGGQGTYVIGLRAALERSGVVVTTISGSGEHAIPFPKRSGRPPLDFSWYVNHHPELVDSPEYDVVHILGGPGGVLFDRHIERPVVYTATHTYRQAHPGLRFKRLLEPFERRAYARADMIAPISHTTADTLRSYGIADENIQVIVPGVDIPTSLSPKESHPPLVLFVGRMEPEKGVMDALDAMEAISLTVPIRGVIVGTGSLADAITARSAGKGDDISYLGHVDPKTLHDLYSAASVVLTPSQYEGLGLVALEAMVHGAFVVGYDVDGLRDLLDSGCVLVPKGDVVALTREASTVLLDPQELSTLQARGRTWASEQYSWDRAAGQFIALYERLLAPRS